MPMKVRYTVVDGEVIAEKRGGVRHELVPDLGSTRALLDNTQTQTDTFSYWPYGEEQNRTGTTATPFRFVGSQGYYRDSTNRTYVRARYLRTDIARWQTSDPIGLDGGDYNLYRYVKNRPLYMTDPTGLQTPTAPNCNQYASSWPSGPYPRLGPTPQNCQPYQLMCNKGYIYACNALCACLHLGTFPFAYPPNSRGSQCARGCLQKTLPPSQIPNATCGQLYCGHLHCFNQCNWYPSTPFNWPIFNEQCCSTFSGAPSIGTQCHQTGPCPPDLPWPIQPGTGGLAPL